MSEFKINEEFAKENNLTPEQITAITGNVTEFHTSSLAEAKKGWDGKANTDAEAILSGAADLVTKQTGVARKEGEKLADFYTRSSSEFLLGKTNEIEVLKADYDKKLKEFDGGEALRTELDKAKEDLDSSLKKYADFDALKEKAEKFEPLTGEYDKLKKEVSFGSVKPVFPEIVNEFEATAKWNEFKESILKEWDIEFVDNVAIAISKENKHKQEKLKDLLSKHDPITDLLKGRQQEGTGAKEGEKQKIEGVPFEVPVGADSAIRTKLIREYLATKGINTMSNEYSAQFAELNTKMLQKTAS